jgi:hypothetical protein
MDGGERNYVINTDKINRLGCGVLLFLSLVLILCQCGDRAAWAQEEVSTFFWLMTSVERFR